MNNKPSTSVEELESQEALLSRVLAEFNNDLSALTDALVKKLEQQSSIKKPKKTDRKRGQEVVRLVSVTKTYRKNKQNQVTAIEDVTFSIYESEIVALVGPSGSGKSTILNMIGSLDTPTSGSVTVDGVELTTLSSTAKATYRSEKIGYVFQFFYLQPFLTLQKNIEIASMFSNRYSMSEREQEASKLIDAVDLQDRRTHYPKELSGGQMQRAAIARALMNRPKVILADEPTGNLDTKNAHDVMDLFEKVRNEFNTTIIVVTHDQAIAKRADRIITLSDGKVVG